MIQRIAIASILCGMCFAATAADVWLDVDPAAGLFERDVDDAIAVIQAFHTPSLTVRGISVVFGNAPLDEGLPIARELAQSFGPKGIGVYAGASTAAELGKETPAVTAMAGALAKAPFTLLAVGPVTNAASLVMLHPELLGSIEAIVVVAGRRPGQTFTYPDAPEAAFPDFNFESDPYAMQVLLDSPVKLVFAPWEVSSHVWVTQEDLDELAAAGHAGQWIAQKSKSWIAMWEHRFGLTGFNPFDTLAVAYVASPHLIKTFEATAWIEEAANDRQGPDQPKRKPYLLAKPAAADQKTVTYCYEPLPDFKPQLIMALTRENTETKGS